MFRKRFSSVTVFVLLLFGIFVGSQIRALSEDNIYEQLNKFKEVISYAQKYYVDDVNVGKMVESAIEGMLKTLDPHSVYIPPKQLEKVTEDFRGKFEGVGIEFNILHDTITVAATIFGGPSEKVGILPGDKIVKIDGESAVKFVNTDVQKKLRGKKGTKVVVDVVRSGLGDPLSFTIVRDEIPLYSVDSYFIHGDGIGYMTINRFSATTYDEFMNGLRDLKQKGMNKLVLDLRYNPGGYLDQAFRMANEFLSKDQMIVYTKGRRSEFDRDYRASGAGEFQQLPVIVLISNSSASASEIVAGAIQDHDRGLIIGETSFGKGLVQQQYDLPDGSAFRLTTARYYTPTGRLIQRPYTGGNSEEYYKGAMDTDEEDSENVQHGKEAADTSRPRFKTDGGRTVFGGGGITPDYIVKSGKLTEYAAKMRARVFEFIVAHMDKYGSKLREQYKKDDAVRFSSEFRIDESMLKSFVAFGESKGVELNKEQYEKDLDYIKAYLKAQIARNLFGYEGYFRSILEIDQQFAKAITHFPEAKKIAGLK